MGLRLPRRKVVVGDGHYSNPVKLSPPTIEPTHKPTYKRTHKTTLTPTLEPIHHQTLAPKSDSSCNAGRNSPETPGLALNGKPNGKRGYFCDDGVTAAVFTADAMKANRTNYGDGIDGNGCSNGPVGNDNSLLIKAKRKHRDEGGLNFKRRSSAEKLPSPPCSSSSLAAAAESCSSPSTACEIVRGASGEEKNSQTETTTSSGGCSNQDNDHLNEISDKDDLIIKSTSLPYYSIKADTKISDPNLDVSASHKLTNPIISDASLNGNILWNNLRFPLTAVAASDDNLRFPLTAVAASDDSEKTTYPDKACVNVAFDSDEFFATNGVRGASGDASMNSRICDGAKTSTNGVFLGSGTDNGASGAWDGGSPKLPPEDVGVLGGRPPSRLPRVLGGGLGALQLVCSCWRTAASCLGSSLQGERAGDVYSGGNPNIGGPLTSQPHPRPDHGPHHQAPSTSSSQPTFVHEVLQQRSAGSQSGARMLVGEQQSSMGRGMPPHDHNHNTSLGDKDTDELDNRRESYLFPENFNDGPSYDPVDRKSNNKATLTPSPPNTLNKSFPNGFPNFNNFRNNPQGFYDNLCYDAGYASERSPEEEELPVPFDIETLDSSQETASRETTRTPDGLGDQDYEDDEEQSIVLQLLRQGVHITTQTLMDAYPFINEGTMFDVTVEKNSRGLGLSLCGGCEAKGPYAGLLRIKKLYPQMPAWLCGQLRHGDIVLEANQLVLSGLASHEALEVLRTTKTSGVHLLVCRPPLGTLDDTSSSSPIPDQSATFSQDVVSSSMMGVPLASPRHLAPSPVQSSCGEFEINLTKVNGSLGFTLRKRDNSVLGHTIRTLVREPALSDGRIKPGDKILSVNNTDLCGLSHEEAIGFLRTTPETVTIRLYRDVTQTPVSPLSPSEPDDSLLKPKPLRQEARDMLSDLAFRKRASPSMSPALGATGGHSSSPGNPRRRRLQKTPTPDVAKAVVVDRFDSLVRKMEETSEGSVEGEAEELDFPGLLRTDREHSPLSNRGSYASSISRESALISRNTSNASNDTNSLSENSETRRKRPNFLDLDNRQSCPRKTQFTPPHEMGGSFPSPLSSSDYQFLSMGSVDSAPPLGSAHSVSPSFAHLQPTYQSVNFGNLQHHANEHNRLTGTTSDYTISGYSALGGGNTHTPDQKSGLLKWKGMMMAPEEEEDSASHNSKDFAAEDRQDRSENLDGQRSHKMKEVTITLQRGWNSRLGFSLQAEGGATKVVAIYAGCVAAKDGRLRIGDQVLKVNGDDVTSWPTEKVIDLLRKTHGKIDLTILQQPF